MWFWPLLLVKGWKILLWAFFPFFGKLMEALVICCATVKDLISSKKKKKTHTKPNCATACSAKIFTSPVSSVFRVSRQRVLPTRSLDVRDAHLENMIYLCRVGEDLAHYPVLPSCCSPPLFHAGKERTVRFGSDLYCCLSWDQRIWRGK